MSNDTTVRFYNTLTRTVEQFVPLASPDVGFYTCGPTVYAEAQLGNFRTFLFEDIVRRVLELNHFRVHQVMNITDVGHLVHDADEGEDKVELAARTEHRSAPEVTKKYTELFLHDRDALNILPPEKMPKATEHIPEQITLIEKLERKGLTYRTSDGVYFDASKCMDYGKLAQLSKQDLRERARVEPNPEKKNPRDFALWKFSGSGPIRQMEWPSPWGVGFPGWHIECSAMAMKYLGETLDIHASGIDHVSIHHTNEIAQSESATGKPFARFWLHGEFLRLDSGRMGKSEGNSITVHELVARGYNPLAFRYLCLNTHYRKPLTFSWEAMDGAQSALNTLYDRVRSMPKPKVGCAEYEERFRNVLNDDLNTPKALAIVWDLLKSKYPDGAKHRTLLYFDRILGLRLDQQSRAEIPELVQKLATEREKSRQEKDFAAADALRMHIEEQGFTVDDTAGGPIVKQRI